MQSLFTAFSDRVSLSALDQLKGTKECPDKKVLNRGSARIPNVLIFATL
jgi:hypothetical protein